MGCGVDRNSDAPSRVITHALNFMALLFYHNSVHEISLTVFLRFCCPPRPSFPQVLSKALDGFQAALDRSL